MSPTSSDGVDEVRSPYGDGVAELYRLVPVRPRSRLWVAWTAVTAGLGLGIVAWGLLAPAPAFGRYDQWLADLGFTPDQAQVLVACAGGLVTLISVTELVIDAVRRRRLRRTAR